ncbi:MAG: peptidoglycan-binding protein [Bauldia sp.]|nr:peptidoglycan-binding protein [Bauldia sp.]MCW5717209.1 peptidoglycan-binding protein [Bauldia sp.]
MWWIGGDVALDRSGVRAVQAALNRLGFGAGAADGVLGPATRAAIQRFQASIGTRQTGQLTARELRMLF